MAVTQHYIQNIASQLVDCKPNDNPLDTLYSHVYMV